MLGRIWTLIARKSTMSFTKSSSLAFNGPIIEQDSKSLKLTKNRIIDKYFRSLEMHSKRRYKFCTCSVMLEENAFETFRICIDYE